MKSSAPNGPARRYRYTFEPYSLDTAARLLSKGHESLALAPKAVETLLVLVERAGQVVNRDELLESVWPDAFVEPNNLAQQVSMVREALDDRGKRPQYVETVSRRGYRFIAPVTSHARSESMARPTPATPLPTIPQVRYTRSGTVNIAYQVGRTTCGRGRARARRSH